MYTSEFSTYIGNEQACSQGLSWACDIRKGGRDQWGSFTVTTLHSLSLRGFAVTFPTAIQGATSITEKMVAITIRLMYTMVPHLPSPCLQVMSKLLKNPQYTTQSEYEV